jgi:hypothetical protein
MNSLFCTASVRPYRLADRCLRSCDLAEYSVARRRMPREQCHPHQIDSERPAVVSADFRERNPGAHLPSNGMPIAFTVATAAITKQLTSTPRICDAETRRGPRRSKLVQHL